VVEKTVFALMMCILFNVSQRKVIKYEKIFHFPHDDGYGSVNDPGRHSGW
jgi:hypothetical protein